MTPSRIAMAGLLLASIPLLAASAAGIGLSRQYESVDPNKPVVCLLPGRVRKLGSMMTYQERRKPTELTASECEIRGGEYTFFDRANFETALAVWLEAARAGDARAQIHVGEIYEKGWVGTPDYAEASRWYALAAEQGSREAERRLAYFYEQGLGVQRDQQRALELWRSALDLNEELVLASELDAAKDAAERRINELVEQLDEQNLRAARLQRALDDRERNLIAERESLRTANAELEVLHAELADIRESAGDPERVAALEQALDARESEIEDQRVKLELLEADLDAQRAQIVASNRQAELREQQLERARSELQTQAAQGDELMRRLDERNQALERMEAELASARQALQTADDDEDRERYIAQQARIAELEKTLAQERDGFREQLAAADLREEEFEAELERVRAEKRQLAEALKGAHDRMDAVDAELSVTRNRLAETQARAAALEEQIGGLSSDAKDARQQLAAELEQQQTLIASLEAERDQLNARWQNHQAERNELLTQLMSERKCVAMLESELKEYQGKYQRALFQKNQLEQAQQALQFEKQQLARQVEKLNEDLRLAENRGVQRLAEMREELKRTKTSLTQAVAEVTSLETEKAKLESEIALNRTRQQSQLLAMRGLVREPEPLELPRGVRPGRYRALVIANWDYLYMNDLDTPRNDAQELQALLTNRYGFEVEVRVNLTRGEMYEALNRLRDYGEEDFVLVYYAGHGMMDEFEEGYWLPTDYQQGQPLRDAISTSDITAQLKQSDARHVLLVADSCYSGALLRNASPIVKAQAPELMRFWMENRSRTVLSSGGLKPVLDQGPMEGHSVFASALIQVLDQNRGALNGERLHAQVHNIVLEETARLQYLDQQPRFAAIEDAGHENGQFVFIRTGV